MKRQDVIFSNDVADVLNALLRERDGKVFVLTDDNTRRVVWPRLRTTCDALSGVGEDDIIVIAAGDSHKDIATLQSVWDSLQRGGATRHSLLLNVGGGVVTDLGGFAAATFKRGMPFINLPTTLLAAVDAAVGGKTGINYNGLKNEVGAFCPADAVVVSTTFFATLPREELLSGFAEMIKHAMLTDNDALGRLLDFDITAADVDRDTMLRLVEHSVNVKRDIVEQDPLERGLRRALNLGHTVGHAFESYSLHGMLESDVAPLPHGYAVAYGLVVEAVLSHMRLKFHSSLVHRLAARVKELYGTPHFTCDDYEPLLALMRHDKKSRDGEINCSLLRRACGDIVVDNLITADEMKTAFDIFRDLNGI